VALFSAGNVANFISFGKGSSCSGRVESMQLLAAKEQLRLQGAMLLSAMQPRRRAYCVTGINIRHPMHDVLPDV
jgi:hypothetical protein